jgi:hypothetical protein
MRFSASTRTVEYPADGLTMQIAQALRSEFPGWPERHVVPETIYQAVYRPDLGGLCRELPKALRTGRLRRKPHRRCEERRGRLTHMTMIDQRPEEAADRKIAGHWECDLTTGEANRSAIGTLFERSSLYLPGRHTADAIRDAVIDAMKDLPPQLRRSLTWDQGSEMALHAEIAAALGMPVYFCEKASPWQRPSNENTNGLLRQYFRREPTCTATTPTGSRPSLTSSTPDRASRCHGRRRPHGWPTSLSTPGPARPGQGLRPPGHPRGQPARVGRRRQRLTGWWRGTDAPTRPRAAARTAEDRVQARHGRRDAARAGTPARRRRHRRRQRSGHRDVAARHESSGTT